MIRDYNLPINIIKELERKGITKLRPPQILSLEKGVLEDKSLVISSPTSSGKTLVAEFAMMNHFGKGGKTLYIVPLKSLATEKFKSFKKKYESYGLKVAISIGEFDKQDPFLNSFDVIISTSEKVDSLIRHNADFIKRVSCVVVDEIHLLDAVSRGPTIEIVITLLKLLIPKAQIIALSATINNDKELSDWLGAELVKSDYRPVKLKEGVYYNGFIHFNDNKDEIILGKSSEESITLDTLKKNKQAIFFLGSRRNAQGLAKRLASVVEKSLNDKESGELEIISDKIRYSLEQSTNQCKLLSELVKQGIGFHHAGLVQKQKELIEDAFSKRLLKIICATPTLAAGVNLPAFRVIVRDLTRFSPMQGSYFIPVLEVKQMFGRAGRPGLEEYGEALAIAKTESNMEEIFKEYINGSIESIYSKLGAEPALRTHVLALISNNFCNSLTSLKDFFKKTFFAKQYSNLSQLTLIIENLIDDFIQYEFVEKKDEKIYPTQLGKRVCELYLDPLVANNIISFIVKSKEVSLSSFNVFQALCFSGGIRLLRVNNKESLELIRKVDELVLLIDKPNTFDYEFDNFLKSIKTALLFDSWINEDNEQSIIEDFKVFPGDLRNMIYTIDWLLYSIVELSKIFSKTIITGFAGRLRTRIAYGVRDELFSLVSIKNIGRVRARKLFKNGIKNYSEVINCEYKTLAKIIGPGIAKKVKDNNV